jgi:peptidoglycan hydrolase-like protein with peptidoglycan-binding domain
MKAKPIFIAVAAMFSAAAIAGGGQHSSSQGASSEQHSQQGATQQQSQSQNPETVKQVQEKLSAAGLDVGQPDGKIGPKTQAALKQFQEKEGLQASGQLDQETLAALEIGTPEGTSTSSSAGSSSPESSSSGASSAGAPSSGSSDEQKSGQSEQPKSQ